MGGAHAPASTAGDGSSGRAGASSTTSADRHAVARNNRRLPPRGDAGRLHQSLPPSRGGSPTRMFKLIHAATLRRGGSAPGGRGGPQRRVARETAQESPHEMNDTQTTDQLRWILHHVVSSITAYLASCFHAEPQSVCPPLIMSTVTQQAHTCGGSSRRRWPTGRPRRRRRASPSGPRRMIPPREARDYPIYLSPLRGFFRPIIVFLIQQATKDSCQICRCPCQPFTPVSRVGRPNHLSMQWSALRGGKTINIHGNGNTSTHCHDAGCYLFTCMHAIHSFLVHPLSLQYREEDPRSKSKHAKERVLDLGISKSMHFDTLSKRGRTTPQKVKHTPTPKDTQRSGGWGKRGTQVHKNKPLPWKA